MLVAKGQIDAAVAELQQLLVKTPKSLAGHVELGLIHWRAGRLDEASRSLGEALAAGPSDPWPRYWLAKVSVAAGAPRRDLFEKYVSARLDREAAHHESLAWLAILDGKPADAIGPLLKAQELAPTDASLWSTLGRVHTMLKDDTAAFNAYYEAVKLQPSDYDARVQLARYYLDRGLDDKADGELTVALSLREAAEAHYLRGVARRKLKRFEHARQDLEEAMKDPSWMSKAETELKLIR
jgi:Flp pilus assembly protein TadD